MTARQMGQGPNLLGQGPNLLGQGPNLLGQEPNLFQVLGNLGNSLSAMQQQNQLGRLQVENPELYNTALQGQIANQQRQAQLEQRRRMRDALSNKNVLGSLSQQLNLPPELIQATGSLEELQGLANATSPRGGATGEIVRQIMRDNPEMGFTEALQLYQTGFRQGTRYDPETGSLVPIAGAPEALGAIKRGESYGAGIGGLEARMELEPTVERETSAAAVIGKDEGEARALLDTMEAGMPNLLGVVGKLRNLAEVATYTSADQIKDNVLREFGQNVGTGAVAREAYTATVDNEVLPLLKQTFGAAFTVEEGNALRATFGDVNKSPAEKQAALDAVIQAKTGQIESLRKRFGQSQAPTEDLTQFSTEELEAMLNAN